MGARVVQGTLDRGPAACGAQTSERRGGGAVVAYAMRAFWLAATAGWLAYAGYLIFWGPLSPSGLGAAGAPPMQPVAYLSLVISVVALPPALALGLGWMTCRAARRLRRQPA